MERSHFSTVAIATKLFLLVLGLLGCSLPVAASLEVCILSPQFEWKRTGPAEIPRALVPLSQPTLFVREPLSELQLEDEDDKRVLWSWQALHQVTALEGPLAWPLPPLRPGQLLTLRLRPLKAPPDHFATVSLVGAPRQRMKEGDGLLKSLQGRPKAWRPAIETLLAKGDQPLATALLFAYEGPDEPDLNALRTQVAQDSCR